MTSDALGPQGAGLSWPGAARVNTAIALLLHRRSGAPTQACQAEYWNFAFPRLLYIGQRRTPATALALALTQAEVLTLALALALAQPRGRRLSFLTDPPHLFLFAISATYLTTGFLSFVEPLLCL
jgi:hypothetical protein